MKTTTKLNNIQVLRAFAALIVVVFHTGYTLPFMVRPFGSFGVDVFFVISGYIMARILDPASSSSSDFFFRRRVIRIVPPYWFFTILLYLAALRLPQLMGSARASFEELLKSLFFIPFMKSDGLIHPLLFIGWSLNFEMFFYLALALGLLLHKRFGVWIGAGIVLATILACAPFATHSVLARFYGYDISLEFLLGIVSFGESADAERFLAFTTLCGAYAFAYPRCWYLVLCLILLGDGALEATQNFFPDRHGTFADFVTKAFGSIAGAMIANILDRVARLIKQRFLGLNHIRQPRRVCRIQCGRQEAIDIVDKLRRKQPSKSWTSTFG